jgi:hypothetical protein
MGSAQVAPRSLFAIRAGPRHCPLRRAAPVSVPSLKKSSSCTTGPYRSLFQVEVECGCGCAPSGTPPAKCRRHGTGGLGEAKPGAKPPTGPPALEAGRSQRGLPRPFANPPPTECRSIDNRGKRSRGQGPQMGPAGPRGPGPRHCPLRRAAPVRGLSLKKSSSCTTGPYRSLFQVEVECGFTGPDPSSGARPGKG